MVSWKWEGWDVVEQSHVCGVGAAVDVIEGKWKTFILWVLAERPRRFGEARRLLPGISEKVLTQQLRELETDGVVHREVYDEVPPRVEYSLTSKGVLLYEALEVLDTWGRQHLEMRSMVIGGLGAPLPGSSLDSI
ncbi:helix-turn-helix domain-containing protein [Streptomyces sp. H10-C2]|uniref:winged helix-turn-helix transcriptional regulator n=1 Tax=unclassified Streptomyces TaxID=2593676 RepID=UPI0024B93E00|nr:MULTISPECIES: helix-turn-helix domain-containing protein [unclassified Streptomyces]MDJ0344445.1 helix-turn-helix domain-containing protein [Streptomyces sp. PH10-H1]MDJ0372079.1 helix-turn-helix domain-containing protein [Streptomyces sp. H10-C2]